MSDNNNSILKYEYIKKEEKVYDIANIICFFGMLLVCLYVGVILKNDTALYITFGIAVLFLITLFEGNNLKKRNVFAIIMSVVFNFVYAPYIFIAYGIHSPTIVFYFLIGIVYTLWLVEYKTAFILSILELLFYCSLLILCFYYHKNDFKYESINTSRLSCFLNIASFLLVIIISGIAVRIRVLLINETKSRAETLEEEAITDQVSKDVFLLNLSHEIRTPMNAILGNANLLLNENINNNIRDYTYQIMDSCNALILSFDELIKLAMFDENNISIENEKYDLQELISDIVNMVNTRLLESNLGFVVNIESEIPRYLYGDANKIRQVLIIIISNAIKYTDNGEIKLNVDCNVISETDITVNFKIEDTGVGINPKDLKYIFDESHNPETRKEHYEIGLGVCKNIINKMNGSISASSTLGKGSEFTISLPQGFESEEVIYLANNIEFLKSHPKDKKNILLTGLNILVVDDNFTNLSVASALLKCYEANIYTASGGREAIRILEETDMDLVFLDYMMPELNGVDTLRIIRTINDSKFENMPVIALSANVITGAKEYFTDAGFDDFLPKPINIGRLENILIKHLNQYE